MGMTNAKILSVLKLYEEKLTSLLETERWESHAQLKHGLEMIPKMRKFLKEDRREKCFRWLGFLQGIFYCNGIYTIEECANHNRPSKKDYREQNPEHHFDRYAPCPACGDLDGCHLWKDFQDAPDV